MIDDRKPKREFYRCLVSMCLCILMYGCPAIPLVIGGAALVGVSGSGDGAKKADAEKAPAVDTATALAGLKERHPDINFNQEFPESYAFREGKKKTWEAAMVALKAKEETILLQDEALGELLTAAKGLCTSENGKSLYYQVKIVLAEADSATTKVTVKVSTLESGKDATRKTAASLPEAENILRGIFFGEMYSLIHSARSNSPAETDQGEIRGERVYTVQSGDTIGSISRKTTGTVGNAKKILEYNRISNAKTLKAGQNLKIPADLLSRD